MIWVLVAAVGAVLVPVAVAGLLAWRSFFPPRLARPLPERLRAARVEEVAFPSGKFTLRGWLLRPGSSPRGVVVLLHGWGSNAANMIDWFSFLAENGWICLAFDTRGHGQSDRGGKVTLLTFAADLQAAVAFVAGHPELAGLPRAVVGHSMGGAATLLALSRGLEAGAAVISSAFARVEVLTDFVLRKWFLPPALFGWVVTRVWSRALPEEMAALEPEATIRSVGVPLLLSHGAEDPLIPDEEVRHLEEAAPAEHTRLLIIPGAHHSDLTDHPVYRKALQSFMTESLEGASPVSPKSPGTVAAISR
jgi:alpha-beta hydrolase superfamily lysophospholipase